LTTGHAGDQGDERSVVDDLYRYAPCGILSMSLDCVITAVNVTFATWLGRDAADLVGRPFPEFLSAGGRIHFETHFAPVLHMFGHLSGVTVDLVAADGSRLPTFLSANLRADSAGRPGVVRVTAVDASDRRSYEQELLGERRRAEDAQARAEILATTLRRSLLPPSLSPLPGLQAAAYYHAASASEVSGDFYDLFPLTRSRSAFFLGDVCGKDAEAAALTSLTRYTLRAAAVNDDHPEAVLRSLDTMLQHEPGGYDPKRFCTVIFGVIAKCDNASEGAKDRGGFEIVMASGGHPPALLLTADGEARYVPTPGGQAVGMFRTPQFASVAVHLAPGDTLLLYTDGLTEARTRRGKERFDDEGGLLRFAREHAPATAGEIVGAFSRLLDEIGPGVDDDTALLALGVPSAG
jgi:sigma-B regulation protein RsbU (phosphoserine phosphatase)